MKFASDKFIICRKVLTLGRSFLEIHEFLNTESTFDFPFESNITFDFEPRNLKKLHKKLIHVSHQLFKKLKFKVFS